MAEYIGFMGIIFLRAIYINGDNIIVQTRYAPDRYIKKCSNFLKCSG
jgi:hypothetical protein